MIRPIQGRLAWSIAAGVVLASPKW